MRAIHVFLLFLPASKYEKHVDGTAGPVLGPRHDDRLDLRVQRAANQRTLGGIPAQIARSAEFLPDSAGLIGP